MMNKRLAGPKRGYPCGHRYFETEGMMDRLADKLGLDPVEARGKNLIPASAMPYRPPTDDLYDTGDYPTTFDKAIEIAHVVSPRRSSNSGSRASASPCP